MNKATIFGVSAALLALAGPARAVVNADSAANYGGGWTNGSNGGGGFAAWSISGDAGGGWAGNGIWDSANAGLSMGSAFGYVAKGAGSYINLDRSFSQAMNTGDVFSIDLGLNYDAGAGGSKGFALRTAANREIVTVNQAGSAAITVNGANALTNYGTAAMHWTFTQVNATQVTVYATGRSGSEAYSATINATGLCFLANIHFYASAITNDEYAELRQVYFDNLVLSQGTAGTGAFYYAVEDSRATVTGLAENATGAITVPSTLGGYPVTAVGRAALKDRTNVTSLAFASGVSVTNLGASAFQGCSSLALAVLPSGIGSIPPALFHGCTGLVSVTIPAGVASVGDSAFVGCRALASVTLPAGLTSLGESAFLNCRNLASLDIPDGITSIPGQLCYECRGLGSVAIPAGVTNIGYAAFYNCLGLSSLSLPAGLKTVGHSAFHGCDGLDSVSIAAALGSVGDEAFYACAGLQTIYFNGGVTGLGVGVFGQCAALDGVYFQCDVPALGADGGADMFTGASEPTAYYLANPSSWSAAFCGAPAEEWTPLLLGPAVTAEAFRFSVDWADGRRVRVQASTNLLNAAWLDLATQTVAGGACEVSDTNWAAFPQRFYRAEPAED
ncbi:MAG TPA: leucine-rich repeat domain-containing protein [Kiritimatiellia bacterium]|nr:leucine-rich repeat domain-containing protein [Kiritimatiellia bacterium]HRZ12628.1 leucine-rich repeat domain-containing protein [Kiritimatiellia bacterium]HSA17706.1 leucine-rich repeat domain-containing protein [Kiritimatiellia bacterium]